jgi:hypothetical protein
LVEGLDPGVASGAIGGAKRPDCLDISVPGLWFGDGATEKDRLGRRDSVNRIRLAVATSELAVGTAHLDDLDGLRLEEASESGTIGSSALDADAFHLSESKQPAQGGSEAGWRG